MKKFAVIAVSITLAVLTLGSLSVYGYWSARLKTDKNSLTVDTFVRIDVSGDVTSSAHNGDAEMTAVFTVVKYLNDGLSYDLTLKNIEFYEEEGKTDWSAHLSGVWEYKISDTGEWTAMTTDNITLSQNVTNGTTSTLYLRLNETAPATYVDGTLKFSAAAVSAGQGGD
jgi:hypothetical protein